ncbi:MAG: tRNA (adenosine(37)-N6)-threonylcarbamoyltransferase complex transferase subunit TsaD [Candidatus Micrarchaeota archaeon]|nr:tRNA (adenosine(37)-N6)-threonylcarbamoyltransferase complex transferase subunit TsaD [Candidatus Micrarchaeota archaeon]
MLVLGIESTAHTFGAAVVAEKKGKISVLSNECFKYPSTKEGYIPRKLADFHAEHWNEAAEAALSKAGKALDGIDAFAYSQGPGIGHCLHVGWVAAKTLSLLCGKPLVPVNHTVAHVEVGKWWCKAKNPLVVYVSGGNTQIAALQKQDHNRHSHYRVFGETLDIGLGNFLDQVGRGLELEPPDAVGVLKEAAKGKALLPLPYTVKGMSVAYAGLLTKTKKMKGTAPAADICYSAQEYAFSALVEATERCLCHTRNPEVLLCGGNARNRRLQEMLRLMSEEQGARFCVTPDDLSGDQAGMIALTGLLMLKAKAVPRDAEPRQRMRLDEPEIKW